MWGTKWKNPLKIDFLINNYMSEDKIHELGLPPIYKTKADPTHLVTMFNFIIDANGKFYYCHTTVPVSIYFCIRWLNTTPCTPKAARKIEFYFILFTVIYCHLTPSGAQVAPSGCGFPLASRFSAVSCAHMWHSSLRKCQHYQLSSSANVQVLWTL